MKLNSRVNKLPEYMISSRKQHSVFHLAQLKISWQAFFLNYFKRTAYQISIIIIKILTTSSKFLKAISSTQISNLDKSPLIS